MSVTSSMARYKTAKNRLMNWLSQNNVVIPAGAKIDELTTLLPPVEVDPLPEPVEPLPTVQVNFFAENAVIYVSGSGFGTSAQTVFGYESIFGAYTPGEVICIAVPEGTTSEITGGEVIFTTDEYHVFRVTDEGSATIDLSCEYVPSGPQQPKPLTN